MGYTHYWTQPKDYTVKDWRQIGEDIGAILKDVQHVQGIPLAFEDDQPGTQPLIDTETIRFNGLGEDGHETFYLNRVRGDLEAWETVKGRDFCKTARKPYDLAVVACLAYLASLEKKPWLVSSDGRAHEWLEGVSLARRCVPRLANQIDIPMPILKGARWDWRGRYDLDYSNIKSDRYDIHLCIDGFVYVYEVKNEANCYRFPTKEAAKHFLHSHKEPRITVDSSWGVSHEGGQPLFATSGSYNEERHNKLRRLQDKVLSGLIASGPAAGCNIPPPAYARPNEMPGVAREQASLADLYQLCAA